MYNHIMFYVLLVEGMLCLVGTIFIIMELKVLYPVLSQRLTLSLIGFTFSLNGIYLTRVMGIMLGNEEMRKILPSVFGLLAAIFLLYWGSTFIKLDNRWRNLSFGLVTLGLATYAIASEMNFNTPALVGVGISISVFVAMVVKFFRYSFGKSAYVVARKRIFLMTSAFVLFAVFDGVGVLFMAYDEFDYAAIAFSFELLARFLLFSSIVGVQSVFDVLGRIIN